MIRFKNKCLTTCLAAILAACANGFTANATQRPNIVFLLSDDQTTYSLGCYDTPDVQTPHLDQLAQDGMAFDRHYNTTAICMASRASIMTGKYEYKTGCNFKHGPLLQSHWNTSYPILLRQAGYRTAFAGKFGFLVAPAPNAPGLLPEKDFDWWGGGPGQTFYETHKNESMKRYAAEYPHSTLSYGAFGRDFIQESVQKKQPFCLSISFKAPHRPVKPDPKFDHVYRGKTFVKPANYGRRHGRHFSKQSKQGRQYARFSEWGYDKNYNQVMSLYHQQVYAVDAAVGMIRQALEEAGVAESTVILYTSDNGFLCGAHGYGSKVLPYEEASRVPMILLDPRHSKNGQGRRCRALTGNIDIAPTILNIAGVPVPNGIDGKSLMSLYKKPNQSFRDYLTLINVWGPPAVHSLAVVSTDWKYIFWSYGEGNFTPSEELYHLAEDRWEMTNHLENQNHLSILQTLRVAYDQALAHWKNETVSYHDYHRFGVIFDRQLPWFEKRRFIRR